MSIRHTSGAALLLSLALSFTGAFAQSVWNYPESPTTNILTGVAWSGSQFVVVGRSASEGNLPATILTSADGSTWTSRTPGTNSGLNAVIWAGTQWVAVGFTGTILTSPDGITWTTRTSGTTNHLTAVTWTGTQFMAVGYGGTILISPDAINWTSRANNTSTLRLVGVAWTGSQFVVISNEGGFVETAPADALIWTTRDVGTGAVFRSVVWTGTQVVITGESQLVGTAPTPVRTSPDGIVWTMRTTGGTASYYATTWTGSRLISVGTGVTQSSPDAVTWTAGGTTSLNMLGVGSSPTLAVAVGHMGIIQTSVIGGTGIRTPSAGAVTIPNIKAPAPGTIRGYRANGSKPQAAVKLTTP
jgi:hypothetical protein